MSVTAPVSYLNDENSSQPACWLFYGLLVVYSVGSSTYPVTFFIMVSS
ncbi:Uncharacterized protein YR821_2349 [Yersinia ruckeri]|uniref:Uncharacterized protein n=1 Tax=Yersinia ruckeri TaxID=29486 RepID=A0A0A8VF37_YERRU|nr:hypothetical protein yruck0001_8260 [Yersinia ruckeri ATCC 29473]QTD77267.1 Uncharacterized protein YR821_2349 [Yersinia ruckeri]CEK28180.1 hypothetical protein CSF007_12205 [Yersinia ruckeri]